MRNFNLERGWQNNKENEWRIILNLIIKLKTIVT